VVVDFDRKIIGVVSQSDISDKVAAENKCPAWSNVTEIMSRDFGNGDSGSEFRRLPCD